MDKHRVAVAGASGRMGHMLIEAIHAAPDCQLAGALDVAASAAIGQDAAAFLGHSSGVAVTSDLKAGLKDAQVLIDFTRPEGTLAHLRACRELGVGLVVGTTGFSDAQKAEYRVIRDLYRASCAYLRPGRTAGEVCAYVTDIFGKAGLPYKPFIAGHGVVPFLAAARDAGCRTATGDQMVEAVQDMMLDFIARTLMLASVVERQALRAHPESRRECPLMARR